MFMLFIWFVFGLLSVWMMWLVFGFGWLRLSS